MPKLGRGFNADGIYLYNHIKGLPVKVIIHNIGTVASIATVVYVAAKQRYCSEYGAFMIHPTEMPHQQNMRAEILQSLLNASLVDDKRTENILRERTTMPDDILKQRRFKEVHITPEQAVKFDLVHTICDFKLPTGNKIVQI